MPSSGRRRMPWLNSVLLVCCCLHTAVARPPTNAPAACLPTPLAWLVLLLLVVLLASVGRWLVWPCVCGMIDGTICDEEDVRRMR